MPPPCPMIELAILAAALLLAALAGLLPGYWWGYRACHARWLEVDRQRRWDAFFRERPQEQRLAPCRLDDPTAWTEADETQDDPRCIRPR